MQWYVFKIITGDDFIICANKTHHDAAAQMARAITKLVSGNEKVDSQKIFPIEAEDALSAINKVLLEPK